jgi:hypothetical protein
MPKRRRCKRKHPHEAHEWENLSLNVVVATAKQGMSKSRFWCTGKSEAKKETK